MGHKWQSIANLALKPRTTCTFSYLVYTLLLTDNLLKKLFDFFTAGKWGCIAAVELLPALHYTVPYIFFIFGIIDAIVELGQ